MSEVLHRAVCDGGHDSAGAALVLSQGGLAAVEPGRGQRVRAKNFLIC